MTTKPYSEFGDDLPPPTPKRKKPSSIKLVGLLAATVVIAYLAFPFLTNRDEQPNNQVAAVTLKTQPQANPVQQVPKPAAPAPEPPKAPVQPQTTAKPAAPAQSKPVPLPQAAPQQIQLTAAQQAAIQKHVDDAVTKRLQQAEGELKIASAAAFENERKKLTGISDVEANRLKQLASMAAKTATAPTRATATKPTPRRITTATLSTRKPTKTVAGVGAKGEMAELLKKYPQKYPKNQQY